jgi:hypothetical protein
VRELGEEHLGHAPGIYSRRTTIGSVRAARRAGT